jgi:hypothetical protein
MSARSSQPPPPATELRAAFGKPSFSRVLHAYEPRFDGRNPGREHRHGERRKAEANELIRIAEAPTRPISPDLAVASAPTEVGALVLSG